MRNKNIKDMSYAQWLENALRELIDFPVRGISIFAVSDTGEIYNNYYNISVADKYVMSGFIQQDALIDSMVANGYIEEDDDDEEDVNGTEEE